MKIYIVYILHFTFYILRFTFYVLHFNFDLIQIRIYATPANLNRNKPLPRRSKLDRSGSLFFSLSSRTFTFYCTEHFVWYSQVSAVSVIHNRKRKLIYSIAITAQNDSFSFLPGLYHLPILSQPRPKARSPRSMIAHITNNFTGRNLTRDRNGSTQPERASPLCQP